MSEVRRYWLPSKPENGFSKDVEVVLAWDFDRLKEHADELERRAMALVAALSNEDHLVTREEYDAYNSLREFVCTPIDAATKP